MSGYDDDSRYDEEGAWDQGPTSNGSMYQGMHAEGGRFSQSSASPPPPQHYQPQQQYQQQQQQQQLRRPHQHQHNQHLQHQHQQEEPPRMPLSPRYNTAPPLTQHLPPSHRRQRIHEEHNAVADGVSSAPHPSSPFRQHRDHRPPPTFSSPGLSPPNRAPPPPPPPPAFHEPTEQLRQHKHKSSGKKKQRPQQSPTPPSAATPATSAVSHATSERLSTSSITAPTKEELAERLVRDGKRSSEASCQANMQYRSFFYFHYSLFVHLFRSNRASLEGGS